MRNRPSTCLFFVLEIAACIFLLVFEGLIVFEFFYEAPPPDRLVLGLCFLQTMLYLGMAVIPVSYGFRNIAHGLPLPTVWHCVEANHGSSMRKVRSSICDEPVEYLAIFTRTGSKLAEVTNFHPNHVSNSKLVSQVYEEHSGVITVHNHPGRDDLPFSPADVYSAMYHGESRSIVVTRSSIYELFLPRKYSRKEAARARDLIGDIEGLFPTRARRIRACERVAAEFGMTFRQSARHTLRF